jgi:hypothetical protein
MRSELFPLKKSPPGPKVLKLEVDAETSLSFKYIFAEVSNLNISMQGCNQTLTGITEKLTAFKGKLKLWKRKIEETKTTSLLTLNLLLENKNSQFSNKHNVTVGHLAKATLYFNCCIPEDVAKYSWVHNPFDTDAADPK